MLTQTMNYLDAFARFRQKENVEAVERLLSAHKQLAKFERAQIGTAAIRAWASAQLLQLTVTDQDSCRITLL
jgi:DNA-directed RNA polymerase II subunit RPB4